MFIALSPSVLFVNKKKYDTKRLAGLLPPLPIPSAIWKDVSLNFITGLPPSHDFTIILVVMDNFSKWAHFRALSPHNTAYKTALLFLDIVCKHHGFPQSMVSDRDPLFISKFWRSFFALVEPSFEWALPITHRWTIKQRSWIASWSNIFASLFMTGHPNGINSKIHPKFHISLSKLHHRLSPTYPAVLPLIST